MIASRLGRACVAATVSVTSAVASSTVADESLVMLVVMPGLLRSTPVG